MVEQGFGPASAELAYEHLFTYTARAGYSGASPMMTTSAGATGSIG
jgi:hypothetical protein